MSLPQLTETQIEAAAELAGTPLYAYSAPALRARVQQLKSGLPDADFVYSLKANPNLSIVQCLTNEGIGTEVCSLFELETSLAAGVRADQTIYVGPAKSPADLRRAIQVQVKAIIAESIEELTLIDTLATELGVEQPVALRVNPEFHTKGARLSMSGKPTQFGIEERDIPEAIELVTACRNIRLSGLHIYMGTRILDYAVVVQNTHNILALADRISAEHGVTFDFVDIGGGYGVPYSASETALDFDALCQEVGPQLRNWKVKNPKTRVVIELGRYMVAEAGQFVTAVRYLKTSKGKPFAICDGGSNLHAAAAQAASFRRNFPIRALRPRTGATQNWTITGPLCTPTDTIGQNVELPPLLAGDLICIERSGAYGLTHSPQQFLSFASPAEVLVDGDRITQIRAPGSLSDFLAAMAPTPLHQPIHDTQLAEI